MITKTEAQKVWTDRDRHAFEEAEKRLDVTIMSGRETPITVDMNGVNYLSERVKKKLADKYTEGGWFVTWQDGDQRDPGPFITLS